MLPPAPLWPGSWPTNRAAAAGSRHGSSGFARCCAASRPPRIFALSPRTSLRPETRGEKDDDPTALLRQYRAQRGDRRHKEVCGSGQDHELVGHVERAAPVARRVVRIRLVHFADDLARCLTDDRVVPRNDGAARRPRLAPDKAGVVGVIALDKLELALDRGLIAHEHEPAAVPGRRLARLDFRPERNAGADD